MLIRTLIVDDEPWARTRIASLLSTEPAFDIVGRCAGGQAAIETLATTEADLVFLDVQMPDVGGFAVIEAIGRQSMPLVVFATAYDEYAVRAFDAHAFDYLLKPFEEQRFRRTLERVRAELQSRARPPGTLSEMMDSVPAHRRYLQRVVVKTSGRVIFLKTSDIDWLEGSGNYVSLHVGPECYLLRESLSALEGKLDPVQFIRLHRSAIVNVDRIRQITPWSRGEQAVVLTDGTSLTIGRMYRDRLAALLTNSVA